MMHTYEGWQVAPFDNPLRGDDENTNVIIPNKNNPMAANCSVLFHFQYAVYWTTIVFLCYSGT